MKFGTVIKTAPRPRRGTKYRVEGPLNINGMNVWRVLLVPSMEQYGPDCFSMGDVRDRLRDLHSGKKVIWMGHTRMTPRPPSGV